MPTAFEKFNAYTYEDAVKLFGKERRTQAAQTARKLHGGDHWMDGAGYIGQKPDRSYDRYPETMLELRDGFASENVVLEVSETHVGGVLGKEPQWWFVDKEGKKRGGRKPVEDGNDVANSMTPWWDEREGLAVLSEAAEGAVLEGIDVLRYYFPEGLLGEGGTITKPTSIAEALDYLYCENLTADKAGVFTDEKSKQKIGVYLYEEAESEAENAPKRKMADLCYLDDQRMTVLRRVTEKGGAGDTFGPYDLGGRLLMHEICRQPLITDPVIRLQKLVNLAHTMMGRNVNLAGNRTTDVINAQRPRKVTKETDATTGVTREVKGPGAYKRTPGYVNFLWGEPIYSADNSKIVGYTNPMVNVTDPVPVDTFVETRDHYYAAILGQCFMRHVLISGDATASGRSREQARKEYERSLQKTKGPLDAAGRWKLETALRMAAELAGKTAEVRDLRAYFDCRIERVERGPAERQEDRADVQAGVMSAETLMSRNAIEDTGAELEKIKQERKDGVGVPKTRPGMPSIDQTGRKAVA